MKKPLVWLMAALFVVSPSVVVSPCLAQECVSLWLNGEIIAVDRAGEQFALRVTDTIEGVPKEIVFRVAQATVFVSGSQATDFNHLDTGDKVSVLLCREEYINPVAKRVLILGGIY